MCLIRHAPAALTRHPAPLLLQYASAEADRAQARARGAIDNNLGACYQVPVRCRKVTVAWKASCCLDMRSTRLASSHRASAPATPLVQDTISKQVLSTVASPPRVRFGAWGAHRDGRATERPLREWAAAGLMVGIPSSRHASSHCPPHRHQQAAGHGREDGCTRAWRLQDQAHAGCARGGLWTGH